MGFVPAEEFLEVARDPTPIQDLDPEATTVEGYLFPSTYHVTRRTTAAEIARMMMRQFRKTWQDLDAQASVHDTVTLASLVEKETGVAAERPLIAAVFHNRLRRGIKMECDPTVIYAAILEGKWKGAIHRSDLDREHPYNTYLAAGLPPGPIASPGAAALEAAVRPADSGYIFFVAKPDNSGEHVFSKTLAAHNRAVGDYRRGRTKTLRQARSE
ncbi:MAG: endolytic transglycosylase MltG [bacterium]|nr:endolytic transglycosylase MltG [bacterium]